MTKKQKNMVVRLILSAILFISAVWMEGAAADNMEQRAVWVLFIAAYLAAGYDIPLRALRNIRYGEIFDENFLMTIATFGAVAIGALEEAVAVMLFYQIGELFSDYAVNKSRKSITQLMDINPEYANLLNEGEERQVDPYEVKVGDRIIIKAGEKVPLDGIVRKGSSSLDTKALTGESMPVEVTRGQEIVSGSINLDGVLEVEVTKLFDDSTVAKILELVENASSRKAKAEYFITRFARIYTPIVVALAVALALIPPLILNGEWSVWIYRACSFLVVSCPCALVISVPLSFFGGLGAASRQGILMKGSNYLEAMASLNTVVFDKTGTLTAGKFQVTDVSPSVSDLTGEELLKLAAYGEFRSNHPIAQSVRNAYTGTLDASRLDQMEEIAGLGVAVYLKGEPDALYIGNQRLMERQNIEVTGDHLAGTVLYIARGSRFLGHILIEDQVREDVPIALKGLRLCGVSRLVMLTGDKESVGREVGKRLGLDEVYGGLLPGDKVEKVEELLDKKRAGTTLGFVGDGINDAPVLARADIGIAMGGIGSDAAVEAADVVIMTDEPSKLVDAIAIARKSMVIVKQNIVFAIGVKVGVLILTAFGFASMWAAVFADVGVSVLAILNAVRALYYKRSSFQD